MLDASFPSSPVATILESVDRVRTPSARAMGAVDSLMGWVQVAWAASASGAVLEGRGMVPPMGRGLVVAVAFALGWLSLLRTVRAPRATSPRVPAVPMRMVRREIFWRDFLGVLGALGVFFGWVGVLWAAAFLSAPVPP